MTPILKLCLNKYKARLFFCFVKGYHVPFKSIWSYQLNNKLVFRNFKEFFKDTIKEWICKPKPPFLFPLN